MKPIGPLMIEHRLIERMVRLVEHERDHIRAAGEMDADFLGAAIDFFSAYADRCHHGKEETILFKRLEERPLSAEHRQLLGELLAEHEQGRRILGELAQAAHRLRLPVGRPTAASAHRSARGVAKVAAHLTEMLGLYPAHIQKEDQRFFLPAMDYFSAEEQASMLGQMWEFDRKLIHQRYREMVEQLEGRER